MEIRIAKFLAAAGVASRRKCEELVNDHKVVINDTIITDLAYQVDTENDIVVLNGQIVEPEEKQYFAVYKPKGVVCSASDEKGRATILDLFPEMGARLYNVGRLDKESEGLLILTNDGDLCRTLTHPSTHIPKSYRVILAGKVSGTEIDKLREGVWIDGKKVRVSKAYIKKSNPKSTMVDITIEEGLNRQIRRMFGRLHLKVTKLTRIQIGKLSLGKLKQGQFRELTAKELLMLRTAAEKPSSTEARPALRRTAAERKAPSKKSALKRSKKSFSDGSFKLGSGMGKISSGRNADKRTRQKAVKEAAPSKTIRSKRNRSS